MKELLIVIPVFLCMLAAPVISAPPANLSSVERLGMHLYKDKNLSFNGTQSCQVCHHPFSGFADRRNSIHPYTNVTSTGADGVSKGGRNAPTSSYAGFSPPLQLNAGEWIGGLFWDGRADGSVLGDPLAEQAQGPPLNPVEMAMPDKSAVVDVIRNAFYSDLFLMVFGVGALDDVDLAYDNFARAVAAYERSSDVTAFSSKFDTGTGTFSDNEQRGWVLFQENCSSCHATTAGNGSPEPLFTNYSYHNIGVPANPLVVLDEPDPGLGAIVNDPAQDGKFKVPTLRNVAMSPPYSHNGVFPTLTDMVSFINDRSSVTPELDRNITDDVGSLGLSDQEIDDIVQFLMTLTDFE